MKILHLVAPARFGGLERVVLALAAGQKEQGLDVKVLALLERGAGEPPLIADLQEMGITVIPVVQPARAFRRQRRSLREVCRRATPDVIHSHGYLSDMLAASLGSSIPVARVTTVHGFTGGGLRNRFYEWLQRFAFFRLDAIVAVSRKLAKELAFAASSRRQVHALANAWRPAGPLMSQESAREVLNISGDAFNVGWVGRISHEKGLDVLIAALRALPDLPVHCTVIGEGAERSELERRVLELQIAHRVSWFGEITQASCLFPAFDLFVNSSRTEGTPITLFEAMHAGVPIVATSVGGVPDVLSPDDALLIPPEDPPALASAIREVYDHRVDAARRASHARSRLERDFAATPWIESYERIYRNAVIAKGRE